MLSDILKRVRELIVDKLADGARDANAPRFGQCPQPRTDRDGFILGEIAETDRDAEPNAIVCNCLSVALDHGLLHLYSTAHSLDRSGEPDEHTVVGGFQNPTVMLGNLGIDDLAAMRLQAFDPALPASCYQAGIARSTSRFSGVPVCPNAIGE